MNSPGRAFSTNNSSANASTSKTCAASNRMSTIAGRTELKIGGTRIELIPIHGGETHDAMFINFPDQGVMFVGDFIMPYLGAPFVEEGDFQGLLDAIDIVVASIPSTCCTATSRSPVISLPPHAGAAQRRPRVAARTGLERDRRGEERGAIQQANLIPPGLLNDQPDVYQPYLILREHIIDRLYDQNVGYWQPDLQGLDHLGRADRAELLVDYLGVSERQLGRPWNGWLPTASTSWRLPCSNRPETGSSTARPWRPRNGSSTSS